MPTGTSGPKFDCAHLVNDSPNNTGLRDLPAAEVGRRIGAGAEARKHDCNRD